MSVINANEESNLNNLLNIKRINNISINTSKSLQISPKYISRNKKLFLNKANSEIYLSAINKKNSSFNNSNYNIESPKNENNKLQKLRLFSPLLDKIPKTLRNINNQKMKIKRNFSSFYIDSSLSLKKNYISDLLIQNKENIKNKITKISDIEKRMSCLEKKFNFKTPKKNSTFIFLSQEKKEKDKNNKKILPDYLKEKIKIRGTNVLSPFCSKIRDKYILEKFNKYLEKNKNNSLISDKKCLIDNKLNILYAENEEMYQDKLKKMNNYYLMKGKRIKYKPFSTSRKQLGDMEKEIYFMKDIFKYVFPDTSMLKLNEIKKYFKKIKTNYKNINNYKK